MQVPNNFPCLVTVVNYKKLITGLRDAVWNMSFPLCYSGKIVNLKNEFFNNIVVLSLES